VKARIENEDSKLLYCVPTVVDVDRVSNRVALRVSPSRVSPRVASRVASHVAPRPRASPALPILRRMLALSQKLP
jgi:hypothetical protein